MMIALATLVGIGKAQEMRLHMAGALNFGITADELRESVVLVAFYAWDPAAIEGIRALTAVTTERQ
jgi:alkylhydroperoxidase/carboxymuconolactone decarboxylase family protein YurZ